MGTDFTHDHEGLRWTGLETFTESLTCQLRVWSSPLCLYLKEAAAILCQTKVKGLATLL